MALVSVIVPVYNAEKYIEKCIDSIVNQTYKEIELILVNDGSTDQSLEKIKKYNAIVIDKKNGGASSARNEGLRRATGDYIMFLDSDDWLDPHCVEHIMKNQADIIRFNIVYEYASGASEIMPADFNDCQYIDKKDFSKEIYYKILTGIKMNSVCRNFYKREVIEHLYFDEGLDTAEDLIFNIEAYTKANSFLYVHKPFYHYMQISNGITGNGISVLTKYKCNIKVSMLLIKKLKGWNMLNFRNVFLAFSRPVAITVSKLTKSKNKR
ncbi:MAG TPA: glycosyltransferase [Clostridiales bacterium]|nr:glycosyltransferase [Clostridiales bacterium]